MLEVLREALRSHTYVTHNRRSFYTRKKEFCISFFLVEVIKMKLNKEGENIHELSQEGHDGRTGIFCLKNTRKI